MHWWNFIEGMGTGVGLFILATVRALFYLKKTATKHPEKLYRALSGVMHGKASKNRGSGQ